MSISGSDIRFKLSTDVGPGHSEAGSPNASLGGFVSTTELVDATLHNLFAVVGGDENLNEESRYRCLFIHNTNPTTDFLNVRVFIPSQVAGGAVAAVGVDETEASDFESAVEQAVEIANEESAPVEVAFSAPEDYENGLLIGDLAPNEVRAIWVRRVAQNSAALANDGVTIRIQGESL